MNEARLITFNTLQKRCKERNRVHHPGWPAWHWCNLLIETLGIDSENCNSRNCPVWRRLRKVKP